MKKIFNKKNYYYCLLFITFLLIILALVNKVFQNDTFYSIKIGKDILKYGIDFKDHYSWINNLPYSYPHWAFDLLTYFIYNFFSFDGIYFITVLCYFLIGIFEYYCLNKISNNKLISFLLTLIVIILIKNFITWRAQILTYILTILFSFNLYNLIKTNKNKYIIFLSVISLLIVNLHIAFWPFIFLLFLPFYAERLIYKIFKKRIKLTEYVNDYSLKKLNITLLLCVITGFLTPLKFYPYTYLIKTIKGVSQLYISEHSPLVLWGNKFFTIYLIIILFILHNKKIKLSDLFLLLGLSIMMISSTRHRSLFIILSPLVLIKYIDIGALKKINLKKFKYLYEVSISLICILYIWIPCINKIKEKNIKQTYFDSYPVEATKFIKNNIDYKNKRIYNSYNIGSYLLFNDIKVMFDSRADLYTVEFNNKYDYFSEFMEIYINNVEKILTKYKIDYIIIDKSSNLNYIFKKNKKYKKIYKDKKYNIYVINR